MVQQCKRISSRTTITGAFQEREHGITMDYITDEFLTDKCHYNIIDASGLEDFMKNMITGASQDDVDLIMDPADGYFTIATAEHTANLARSTTFSMTGTKASMCMNCPTRCR